jgi:hypothetical protein
MRTYPVLRESGSLLAFEISSTWLTFRPLFAILRSIEGVSDVQRCFRGDDRITFKFRGEPFTINEPWGDNSRYWVGPANSDASTTDVSSIHNAFAQYQGPGHRFFAWLRGVRAG